MVIDNQATLSEYLAKFETKSKLAHNENTNPTSSGNTQTQQTRFLPQLLLPKFSGMYKEWTPFRDLFESMVVNNATIPEVEKFHYLKLSVTGEAVQLINNLVVTGDNFKLAWQLISDRYENRRVLVDAQLELLFSLKRSSHESAAELKRLYGTTTEVLVALKGLKCDTNN
nr:PREDICTED: uncharacterized protein LOC105663687 [Megachile rotundata]